MLRAYRDTLGIIWTQTAAEVDAYASSGGPPGILTAYAIATAYGPVRELGPPLVAADLPPPEPAAGTVVEFAGSPLLVFARLGSGVGSWQRLRPAESLTAGYTWEAVIRAGGSRALVVVGVLT